MSCQVVYTPRAVADLKSLDRPARALVYGWITKNLEGCADPRWQGDGDRDGGRWRYCIGEYRLIAEIEGERIVILAVNTGLGLRLSWKNMHAGPNVFLKSTLRQPVKTALLLAVMALITFAFVSRGAEYLLVKQETERMGSYYRSIGTLQSATGNKWADTTEAVAYLEENASVQTVQTVEYTSAVIQDDIYNADIGTENTLKGIRVAFYGTLQNWDTTNFYFTVDTVLAGYPEHISEGGSIVLFREYGYDPQDVEYAYEQLEKGGRYLAVGYYYLHIPSCRVVESDDGTSRVMHARVNCPSDDLFFTPVPEGSEANWSGLKDHQYEEGILLEWDNQRALNIIPTKDMSALPIAQDSASGIYLTDGRWLDSADDELGRTVCVINEDLASRRGLKVGDTLTLKLRDVPSHFGVFKAQLEYPSAFLERIQTKTDTYEIVGIYGYISQYNVTYLSNFTYIPDSAVPDSFAMTTPELLDETAWGPDLLDSYIEQAGGNYEALPHPRDISFVLASPDMSGQFLSETRDDLAAMGWKVVMLENNWENFQAAAKPMVRSSLMNAAIFSALLLVTFCLLAVVYYRMRRKEIAIARALGVPARRCVRDVSVPLLLLGVQGIAAGACLGWQYTLGNAAGTLSAFTDLGEEVLPSLPVHWLAVLGGGAFVLLLAVTLGGAAFLSSRPVLALVQGGALTARKDRTESAQAAGAAAPSGALVHTAVPVRRAETAPAESRRGSTGHVLRFVWRHITRAKLKSGLSILLAAGFTAGLAAIQLSIGSSQEKIDWLYENTAVEAELLLADSSQDIKGSGFLRQSTVDALLDSGYVTDAYLEGSATGAVTKYVPGMENEQILHIVVEDTSSKTIRAFDDEAVFLSPAGSGGAVTITYLDGWDGSLFAGDWTADEFPVVLPKAVYEAFGGRFGLSCKGFRVCEAAGYYEGEVASMSGETDPILIPLSAYRDMSKSRTVSYSKAHVTLDPSLNRELETFTQMVNDLSASQGMGATALRAVIWDEELRLAVAPLENSIELMEVLYPVTLVLSLLVAVGIAVLFVMTSAKEAAIMRVLGTSKLRSRVMLALQTAFTSAAGLLIGLAGVLAYTGRTRPELLAGLVGASALCAVLYLLAAIIGAAASSTVVTSKNPLELLQVRE